METATTRFIKDALAGGWDDTNYAFASDAMHRNYDWVIGDWEYDEKVFLDPNAWRAVGKTRGWGLQSQSPEMEWLKFGVFANHLFSGKDINTALEGIE